MLKKSQVLKEGRRQGLQDALRIIKRMLNESEGGYGNETHEIWNWVSRLSLSINEDEQRSGELESDMTDDEWQGYLESYPKPFVYGEGYDPDLDERVRWNGDSIESLEYNAQSDCLTFSTYTGSWRIDNFRDTWAKRNETANGISTSFNGVVVVSSENEERLSFDEIEFVLD